MWEVTQYMLGSKGTFLRVIISHTEAYIPKRSTLAFSSFKKKKKTTSFYLFKTQFCEEKKIELRYFDNSAVPIKMPLWVATVTH